MAKVQRNVVINGVIGKLGDQLVLKRDRTGRTIISIKPTFPADREFSEMQKAQQGAFKEAVAYARTVAKIEPVYAERAEALNRSAYNVAIADWLHPPEIGAIDLGAWTGRAGESIRVKAEDDVVVVRVMVTITDERGEVIEQGEAKRVDGVWWVYTTMQAAPETARVIAVAEDLAGHIGQGMG